MDYIQATAGGCNSLTPNARANKGILSLSTTTTTTFLLSCRRHRRATTIYQTIGKREIIIPPFTHFPGRFTYERSTVIAVVVAAAFSSYSSSSNNNNISFSKQNKFSQLFSNKVFAANLNKNFFGENFFRKIFFDEKTFAGKKNFFWL